MNILFLSNNSISTNLFNWIKSFNNHDKAIFESSRLTNEKLLQIAPNIVISFLYHHILSKDILENTHITFINLHPSFLPYNRGADPNIWSFLDNTCKGVSIHMIDEGIDTGDILVQKQVHFDQTILTLADSYSQLIYELEKLFKSNWQKIRSHEINPTPQIGRGTFHLKNEFQRIKNNVLGPLEWDTPIKVAQENYKQLKITR